MSNLFNQFVSLAPSKPTIIVSVISVDLDNGTSVVESLGGTRSIVFGTFVLAGNKAIVQDGNIVRQSPNYNITEVTI